jgi:redox-sensitive bicupin YhaK (pirin superfamily)
MANPSGPVVFRPAAERFHSSLDWLNSWHTFSFASHHHPDWMGFGPLRVINDDTIEAGRGFGLHPHREMEIITVMVNGEITHRDSMGHAEPLRAGEVQRMSAGTGLLHSEINEGSAPCRLLQIWIDPSSSGRPPSYEQKPFVLSSDWKLLIDPECRHGAVGVNGRVRLWRAQPPAGQPLPFQLGEGTHGWIQMIDGLGQADDHPLEPGDGLGFAAGDVEQFTAGPGGADLLLFELG